MNTRTRRSKTLVALLAAPLLLSACGGGGTDAAGTPSATPTAVATLNSDQAARIGATPGTELVTAEATPTESPTATPTETPGDAVSQLQDAVAADTGIPAESNTPADYDGYDTVASAAGTFSFDVPTAWGWRAEGVETGNTPSLVSAPTQAGYFSEADPGLLVGARAATDADDPAALLTGRSPYYLQKCTSGERRPYEDDRYVGVSQTFTKCNGTDNNDVIIAVKSKTGPSHVAYFEVAMVTAKDVAAFGRAIRSFSFTG